MAAKLPVGIQDFEKLISGGYTYVDKTEYIYEIVNAGYPTFISRPRRFGKSLMVSTLEAIFLGKRELFKNLWIDQSDWDWKSYPVLRLDMSKLDSTSPDNLETSIRMKLSEIANFYGLELISDVPLSSQLDRFMNDLSQQGKIAVLIDEYDKPIIDQLNNIELAKKNRDILKQFYTIFKTQDANIKFIFLTGVTKFSKVSVFSGLNHLNDITLNDKFSAMLGYTQEEIKKYFADEVTTLAKMMNTDEKTCYQEIKAWYNGYQFTEDGAHVFNPFSVLKLFGNGKFHAHWFATGTPSFLLELIKRREFDPVDFENLEVSSSAFETFEIENIPTLPLLYQTGYLTIKSYDPEFAAYTLNYPNREVSQAFTESLINYFTTKDAETNQCLMQITRNLKAAEWDHEHFFALVKQVYALIPYDLYITDEAHYQSLFYLMVKLAGIKIGAEVHTQKGRIDAVIELQDKTIIFEMKLNKTAKEAIKQIKEKKYYQMYSDRNLPLYLVGMNFDSETRCIDDTGVEVL